MQSKTELCRDYVKRFPKYPRLKLARIIYNENKLKFKDVESVRSNLRYIAGKRGAADIKSLLDKSMIETDNRPFNPYSLPQSDETKFEPFIFSGHKRIAILSDIHVPYHSISSLTAAIEFCKKEKPDGLLLNGDTMDCHHLSRFIKDPKSRDFKLELDTFKALINVFEKQLKCKIYFKIGNHELRYQLFLQQKANELIGVEEFDFENIIKARARGITIIGDKQVMKMNELNGIHGHEYIGGISAPVNVARGLYLRGKVSAFQGHNHSTSEHSETDMNGKIVTTWSLGCLSELHPNYMPLNRWNNGMGIVDLDANGRDYFFRNKRIYKGKVL